MSDATSGLASNKGFFKSVAFQAFSFIASVPRINISENKVIGSVLFGGGHAVFYLLGVLETTVTALRRLFQGVSF